MELYRLHLRPRSPWRTPWQADTLTGALCATCARVHGPDVLRAHLLEPMLAGEPPFVLSDAFPGDLLPIPTSLRLAAWPERTDLKAVKRARWLSREDFDAARSGHVPSVDRLLQDSAAFVHDTTRHNTLGRDSDASLEDGGLFARPDTLLRTHVRNEGAPGRDTTSTAALEPNPALNGAQHLSLYFRAANATAADLLLDLLHELSLTGFGADIATGRGQFEIVGEPTPTPELDEPPDGANGLVVLSTFQPAPGDPTDGYWETFPKFGKLGPDLGLPDVRKNTLVMLRPGACFRADPAKLFLGRALPMSLVLPHPAASTLRERGIEIVHPAFGLAVPATIARESTP